MLWNALQRKSVWILVAVLLLGFAIRVYRIWETPMYGDELTMVYDIYSISKTGMDSTGQKFPLTFHMGSGRPGGYIYFSVPFVELFGPTVWGERSLSLLSGLGIIVLVYFLGKKLFDYRVGTIAALLMAISPWEIYLSRAGYEAHFALFLALLGVTAFVYKKYIWWGVAWGVAIHTYPTFKLTLPLMLVLLVALEGFSKLVKDKIFIIGCTVLAFFGMLAAFQTFGANSEQRFLSENIFSIQSIHEDIVQRVNSERTESTLPEFLKPIFINKQIEYSRILFENYVKNLSPEFLILRGDLNPRQNPAEMGMLYIVDLPLILIALSILWKEKKKEFLLLLFWILVTPLATMFMPETHGLRNGLMLPSLILLSAVALTRIQKKFMYTAFALMVLQLVYILVRVYFVAPNKFASFWSAKAKEVSLDAIEKSSQGEKITLSTKNIDNIEYAYEVYAKVNPREVIAQYGKFPKKFGSVTITD